MGEVTVATCPGCGMERGAGHKKRCQTMAYLRRVGRIERIIKQNIGLFPLEVAINEAAKKIEERSWVHES